MKNYNLIIDKFQFCSDLSEKLGLKPKTVYENPERIYRRHPELFEKMLNIQLEADKTCREMVVKQFEEIKIN